MFHIGGGGEAEMNNDIDLRTWSSWTANSDKKYMELNGAALNVNKPCVTFLGKQPFRKISRGRK